MKIDNKITEQIKELESKYNIKCYYLQVLQDFTKKVHHININNIEVVIMNNSNFAIYDDYNLDNKLADSLLEYYEKHIIKTDYYKKIENQRQEEIDRQQKLERGEYLEQVKNLCNKIKEENENNLIAFYRKGSDYLIFATKVKNFIINNKVQNGTMPLSIRTLDNKEIYIVKKTIFGNFKKVKKIEH